nr:hypothetical protein [Candidatus Sigynarchaeota archaeon]
MPGIGHLIFGLCIVIPLLYLTKDKNKPVNYKVLFIYFVNNYLGPDAAHVYWRTGHYLIGFIAFAIPLSLFYSYMSRFSLHRTAHFFDIADDGAREVNWKNAYYATVAGGISHRMIDGLFHGNSPFGFAPWFDLSLEDINTWVGYETSTWIVLDMAFIVFTIIGALYVLREGFKKSISFLAIIVGTFTIAALATFFDVTGGERDVAVFFFSIVFILAPLLLIAHADREVQAHALGSQPRPRINRWISLVMTIALGVMAGVFFALDRTDIAGFFVCGIPFTLSFVLDEHKPGAPPRISRKFLVPFLLALVTAIVGLFFAAAVAAIIDPVWFGTEFYEFGSPDGTRLVGIIFIVLTSVGLAGCIGSFLHNSKCRAIVMVIGTLAWYLVIPFGLALLLSEKEVKSWFEKPAKEKAL